MSNVVAKSAFSELTDSQLIRAEANILGYGAKLPPTIYQFIDDEYYLGGQFTLYEYWRTELGKIFPTCIHQDANLLALVAGLGVGKSLVSQIICLYILCRLQHLKNLDYFGVTDLSKPIKFVFSHMSGEQVWTEFIQPIQQRMKKSTYFQNGVPYKYKISFVTDTPRGSLKSLGGNVLFYVMSEINFYPNQHKAKGRINIAWNRYLSRFIKGLDYLGMVILDSSPTDTSAIVDNYVKKFAYKYHMCRATQWEVKPFMFSKTYFKVYIGNGITPPFIIDDDHPLPEDADIDDVIDVPDNLRGAFEANIELSLQDQAGISTKSTGTYVKYPEKLKSAFMEEMDYHHMMVVDFFDPEDQIYDKISTALHKHLPTERIIYVGLDSAYASDVYTISIGYYDGKFVEDEDLKILKPTFHTPITIGISRKSGQETPLNKVFTFIIKLSSIWEIGGVGLDTFQSKSLEQDLTREKIRCSYISTDRTCIPTDYVKNAMYEGRVHGPNHPKLLAEWTKLVRTSKGKIDHKPSESKDYVDAQVRCIYYIYKDIKHASKFSKAYRIKLANEMMQQIYAPHESVAKMNSILESITQEADTMSADIESF